MQVDPFTHCTDFLLTLPHPVIVHHMTGDVTDLPGKTSFFSSSCQFSFATHLFFLHGTNIHGCDC